MTRTTLYRAAWVLPIERPPIREGWLLVRDGLIVDVGSGSGPRADAVVTLGAVAVLPGLVNAHTHLELSWMRGRVPPAERMSSWIRALMALRKDVHRDDPLAMAAGVAEARRSGTAIVGDITNTFASAHALSAGPLRGYIFYELLGFNHPRPIERVEEAAAMVRDARSRGLLASVVPHAPYSVSRALFSAIADVAASEQWVTSVHVAESAEEIEFLKTGGGPWRDLIESLGVWNADWQVPGTGPIAYLQRLGIITSRTLVVHGVQLTDRELQRLRDIGATVVTCPRSNEWVGAGHPPIARFFASGVRVAVGTDSLASCPDLNLFSELAAMRRLAPQVSASQILHSATLAGAEALASADEYGSLLPGRRADVLAVTVPDGTTDVEEYLCSGIAPDAVRWLS